MNSPNEQISEQDQQKLTRLESYLQYDPDNISLINSYLSACVEYRCFEQADDLLTRVLDKHVDSAELNAHAGLLRMLQGRFAEAETLLAQAQQLGLREAVVNYNLAYSKFLQGKFAECVALLDEPEQATREHILLLVRALHHTDALDKAIAYLKAWLKANPADSEMQGLLALLNHDAGNSKEAIEAANKALEQDETGSHEALLARGSAHIQLGNYDQAMADLLKTTEYFPDSGRAWSGLGQLNFWEFQFDQALDNLENAVRHMPNHIGTWHLKAWAHLMKNEVEQAFEAFQKSYELDRNFGETHGGLASVYALRGEKHLAEKHLKLAEKLDPHGFAAVYARMVLLNLEGKGNEAVALMNKVAGSKHPVLGVVPQELINARLEDMQKQATNKKPH